MAQMLIKQGMTNKQVHQMKKKTQPGTMGNDTIHLPKKTAKKVVKKMTQAQDDAYDKKHGIKEGSKQDIALDAKRGLKKKTAKRAAKKLTSDERNNLPKGDFVFPGQRRYPIHDENHARNALARAAGKPEEAQVRAAVRRKYPNIK